MVDSTHKIGQSIAILSYIEKLAGLDISDPIIAAKSEAVLQSAQELFAPLNPTINFATGDDFLNKRDAMTPFLLSRFDDLSRVISSNEGKFFIDGVPRACDFDVFHHLDLSTKLDQSLLYKFPQLEKFTEEITAIESVRTYLGIRSELIDVGSMPKLVIDRVPIQQVFRKLSLWNSGGDIVRREPLPHE